MDVMWGAGVILSLMGGWLLILAGCLVVGLILGLPAALMGGSPTRFTRAKAIEGGVRLAFALVVIAFFVGFGHLVMYLEGR